MLNYEEFKDTFRKTLEDLMEEHLPGWSLAEDVRYSINRKISSVRFIPPEGENEGGVLPSFRYDELYAGYAAGNAMAAMARGIIGAAACFRDRPPVTGILPEDGESLGFIAVNKEMNTQLLRTHPHVSFLDMEIIFKIISRSTDDEELSALVTGEMAKDMGMSAEEMLEKACGYMFENHPVRAREWDGAYMLTAKNTPFVTHGLADGRLLSGLAEKERSDLYVMPLSLRMIALFPASGFSADELKTTAKKMFGYSRPEDRLSDHIYLFTRKEGRLSVCL